jgi:hypothetical protein
LIGDVGTKRGKVGTPALPAAQDGEIAKLHLDDANNGWP